MDGCTRRAALTAVAAVVLGCTGRSSPTERYVGLASGYRHPRGAGAAEDVQVVMYMTTWCPHCRRAQRWLDERGHRYIMRDVDRDAAAAARLESLNPRGAVPTFEVGGRVLIGFDEERLEAALRHAAATRRKDAR